MSAAGIRAGRAFVEFGANSAPLDAALARLRGRLQAFGAGLATVGGGLLAASGGVLGALAWPLQLAANLETTQAAFETMLKDGQAARTLLEQIQQFAASTPFEFPELASAAKSLLAFGVAAGDVQSTLTTLGDIASGIGVPIGELSELYGKANVQGRLFAEDVNQLTGRGIPVIQEFAKQFGVSDTAVKGLVESGKIGFPQLQRALQDLSTGSGVFAGGMERQSKTLLGMFSTLKDNIGNAVRPLGQALLPVVAKLAGHLSTAVAVMGRFLEQNSQLALYVAGGAVAIGALGAALVGVGVSVGVTGFALTSLGGVVGTVWGIAAASLAAFSALLGVLASPLGLVAAGAVALSTAFGGWGALLGEVQGIAEQLFGWMTPAIGAAGAAFGAAGVTIRETWASVVAAVSSGNLEGAMAIVTAGLSLAWAQMVGGMLQSWHGATGGFRDAWTDAITYLSQLGVAAFYGLVQVWETVETYIVGTLDWMGTKFQQLASLWSSIWSGEKGPEAYAKTGEMQRQFEQRAAGRGANSNSNIGAIKEEAASMFNELGRMGEAEKAARAQGNSAEIAAAQERLQLARDSFAATQSEAQKVNEERLAAAADKAGVVKKAAENAAGASGGVFGAFNASLAAQQVGANGIRERTAKATERTAKGVEKLVEASADSGLRAG
jgi:tape measure domain-containing protein